MSDLSAQIAAAMDLAQEAQYRLRRIVEMARIIQAKSEHLTADSEPSRFRVCAEVIQEAAEFAENEVERVEIACKTIGAAVAKEAVHA